MNTNNDKHNDDDHKDIVLPVQGSAVVRSSYHQNCISNIDQMVFSYWIATQILMPDILMIYIMIIG